MGHWAIFHSALTVLVHSSLVHPSVEGYILIDRFLMIEGYTGDISCISLRVGFLPPILFHVKITL